MTELTDRQRAFHDRLVDFYVDDEGDLSDEDHAAQWSELILTARGLRELERKAMIERCVETVLAKVILAIAEQDAGDPPYRVPELTCCLWCGEEDGAHERDCPVEGSPF